MVTAIYYDQQKNRQRGSETKHSKAKPILKTWEKEHHDSLSENTPSPFRIWTRPPNTTKIALTRKKYPHLPKMTSYARAHDVIFAPGGIILRISEIFLRLICKSD